MPAERALPVPATHRELAVVVGGRAVPREHQLLAASVTLAANRLAAARLVYLDGVASAGDFPLSASDAFVPGAEVAVRAGAGDDAATLFTGVVVRHALRVREHAAPQLVVECRHAAVRLTRARRSAYHLDQSDADAMAAILDAAGLAHDVAATAGTHPHQVQYAATDWDYLLARAEANGRVVLTHEAAVAVRAPDFGAAPVARLQYGATVLELDAELDARRQWAGVTATTWDPAEQALAERAADDPGTDGPGDLTGAALARALGGAALALAHPAVGAEEAGAWADAAWLRSRLSKATGRAKCEGIGTVRPGDVVTLGGVGARFAGDVWVSAVRHEFDLVQGWKTHLQFGGLDRGPAAEAADASAPRAGGLVPAAAGLQIGVVTSNEDPAGEHRVRVRMPLVDPAADGAWARVAAPDAGSDRGWFVRPEVGDEVVLGFLADDPRAAVVLGMLHSSRHAAPLAGSDANPEKVWKTRSGMRIHVDDAARVLTLDTPAGNSVVLSEADAGVTIADQHGNRIVTSASGITVESATALVLRAGTGATLTAGTSLGVEGGTELALRGAAGAELSSPAVTAVRGALVQLN